MRRISQDTGETWMAKILVLTLFKWQDVEAKSDLERLRLVVNHLPDEALMAKLEGHRKWGRDDYPIRPVWNSILAGIVYQHSGVDSLRRELSRNGQLRDQCGFNPQKGSGAVPPPWVYTRFLKLLFGYRVTRASESDTLQLLPMVKEVREKHRQIYKDMDRAAADKGYDSEANCRQLYDEHGIKPVIDVRRMWRDKETKLLDPGHSDNIVYDEVGTVYCVCPKTGEQRPMSYGGFEKDRMVLKYICPVKAYGLTCKGSEQCGHAMKSERVSLEIDRRIFTPVSRSSYAWEREYKRRTAVERVNSRLDVSFGFERHFIRGQKKMEMRVGLALCVMLTMALTAGIFFKSHNIPTGLYFIKERRNAYRREGQREPLCCGKNLGAGHRTPPSSLTPV